MKQTKKNILKKSNLEIFYEDWFDKKNEYNIIILHWWWGSSQSWLEVWELLFDSWFNVFIPDLPWFWNTKLEKVIELDDYASIIEEFIIALWLKNIILWWHSNWWAISIKIANRWKIEISRLVLNNSAWIRNDKKRNIKRKILNNFTNIIKKIIPKNSNNIYIKKIRSIFYKIIWWQDYLNAEKNSYLKQTYLNMIKSDLKEDIKKIKQNTLIIWWQKDTYTPLSDWYIIRNNIWNSKLIILENEKHWIHLKNPKKLVNTFLTNI